MSRAGAAAAPQAVPPAAVAVAGYCCCCCATPVSAVPPSNETLRRLDLFGAPSAQVSRQRAPTQFRPHPRSTPPPPGPACAYVPQQCKHHSRKLTVLRRPSRRSVRRRASHDLLFQCRQWRRCCCHSKRRRAFARERCRRRCDLSSGPLLQARQCHQVRWSGWHLRAVGGKVRPQRCEAWCCHGRGGLSSTSACGCDVGCGLRLCHGQVTKWGQSGRERAAAIGSTGLCDVQRAAV